MPPMRMDRAQEWEAVIEAIEVLRARKGYPPTLMEISMALGKSTGWLYPRILAMANARLVSYFPRQPRSLAVLGRPLKALPRFQVAGISFIGEPGWVAVPVRFLPEEWQALHRNLRVWRVVGGSPVILSRWEIKDGDMVLVRVQGFADPGNLVLVKNGDSLGLAEVRGTDPLELVGLILSVLEGMGAPQQK